MKGRVTTYFVLAVGVLALACGGENERPTTQPATAGAETTTPAVAQVARQDPGDLEEEEIDAFIDATLQLVALEDQGVARVAAGEPIEQVQAELNSAIERVFASSTMTRDRFDEIVKLASNDADVRSRIENQIDQRLG